ncbi:hypothetical protein [Dactylosporangium matsuzakiense]|uniref:Uncharacterized protein n=1 Tax=Dactylosporangium matsuzakiense TaxID=53360 RepID=A0A9W6NIN2_9ACTN|nr:hypothetical protein [Dactylosporangium matsuzakiense]UWZ47207.1 hypothetical protein Dmats_12835 [Dactylosporangium matsuzakiense]GLK98348.1 hypothetical protein GCM10017581_000890 [Dactylosporangium matsuzakiense]
MTEIEVIGAEPVPERPRSSTSPWVIAIVLAIGAAFGYAVAASRPAPRMSIGVAAAPEASAAVAPDLTAAEKADMLHRVTEYNTVDASTVEALDVRFMTALRGNTARFDDARTYPAGEYRLQVVCLGDGQIWALFRIGEDETYVDMDCHADRVLVTQLVLPAHTGGRRTVTAITGSPLGLAVGLQVLQRR